MKRVSYIIELSLVVFVLLIMQSSNSTIESKVENNNINKTVNLSTMAMKIIENEENRLYTSLDSYTGDLTGYAYNCPLCGGTLACLSSLDLSNGTTTYVDSEYGEVNIVASSKNLPCGTIVRFYSNRIKEGPTIAIVLDRGVLGNALDLLSPSEEYASSNIGRMSITYEVLRVGW